MTGLGPTAVVEMAAAVVEEAAVEEAAVEEAAVDCKRCTLCSGTRCTGNPQDRRTSPRRSPQKNLLRPHGLGYTAHPPVWLIRAWRGHKRGGAMSGHAAFRECRNAGNRPASWNGRTGWASERVTTAGGRAAGRQGSKKPKVRRT